MNGKKIAVRAISYLLLAGPAILMGAPSWAAYIGGLIYSMLVWPERPE